MNILNFLITISFIYFASGKFSKSAVISTRSGLVVCSDQSDCDGLENATCVDFLCNCNGSRFCRKISHPPVTKIGLPCYEKCNIKSAFCDVESKQCLCIAGYVSEEDGKKCLPVSQLGGLCESNVQCSVVTNNSLCLNNKCVCKNNWHEFNKTCFQKVGLRQNCLHDAECFLHNSICLRSQCSCAPNFVESERESLCLKTASGINSPCEDSIQCIAKLGEGSICTGGFCKCQDEYQFKESINKCVRDYLLDEICDNHNTCNGGNETHSRLECILGNCKCRPEFSQIDGECISSSSRICSSIAITIIAILLNYYSLQMLLKIIIY